MAQTLLARPGEADGALISLVGGVEELNAAARTLAQAYPALDVVPRAQLARSEEKVRVSLTTLFFLVAAVMGLTTLLCVITTMVTAVSERQGEIGLKKALGAGARLVVREFLVEAAVLGLGGGLVGLGLGWGLARVIGHLAFGVGLTLPWSAVPTTLLGTVVATVVAALVPVRFLIGPRPAEVLRGGQR